MFKLGVISLLLAFLLLTYSTCAVKPFTSAKKRVQYDNDDDDYEKNINGKVSFAQFVSSPLKAMSQIVEIFEQKRVEFIGKVKSFASLDWLLRPSRTKEITETNFPEAKPMNESRKIQREPEIDYFSKINKRRSHYRMLQTGQGTSNNNNNLVQRDPMPCYGEGVKVVVHEDFYYCDGEEVTESDYLQEINQNETSTQCVNETSFREACLCPADFYGTYCGQSNAITCNIVNPPKTYSVYGTGEQATDIYGNACPNYSDVYYESDFSGDPPCNFVSPNDTRTVSIQAECENENLAILKEGVTSTSLNCTVMWNMRILIPGVGFELPNEGKGYPEFIYYINATNLLSSEPRSFSIRAAFIDWNHFTNSYIIEYGEGNEGVNLEVPQLLGEENIEVVLPFWQVPPTLVQQGRYSVEIIIMQLTYSIELEGEFYFYASNRRSLYFDLSQWSEPTKSIRDILAIILGVVFGLLFLFAVLFYFLYWRNRKNKQIEPSNSSQRAEGTIKTAEEME